MNTQTKPFHIDEQEELHGPWRLIFAGLDERDTFDFFRELDRVKHPLIALRFVTPDRQVISPAGARALA